MGAAPSTVIPMALSATDLHGGVTMLNFAFYEAPEVVQEIAQHGCYCSKLNSGNAKYDWQDYKAAPVDHLDGLCQSWFMARACNTDKQYCQGEKRHTYKIRTYDNACLYDDIDNCKWSTCIVDRYFAGRIYRYIKATSWTESAQSDPCFAAETPAISSEAEKCEKFGLDVFNQNKTKSLLPLRIVTRVFNADHERVDIDEETEMVMERRKLTGEGIYFGLRFDEDALDIEGRNLDEDDSYFDFTEKAETAVVEPSINYDKVEDEKRIVQLENKSDENNVVNL
jgi:hypothetical protein